MNQWTINAAVPAGELRVWLDDLLDDRAAPPGWVDVTTAHAAIALIDRGDVIELSLDHDLGDDDLAGKGVHVVDHIAEQQVVAGRDSVAARRDHDPQRQRRRPRPDGARDRTVRRGALPGSSHANGDGKASLAV